MAAPMSFGVQHLGPALPDFRTRYPDISLELSLSDERVDLVGGAFDIALRIATLTDSTLLSRRLCSVRILLVGSPAYFARFGRPQHPRDLQDHVGLGYNYGASREVWRFRHKEHGEVSVAMPCPIRANNADVLTPLLLAGAGIALQPEFLVWRDLQDGRLETALPGWSHREIALHLVTPPNALRPVRVSVLLDFLAHRFSKAPWVARG
jgi:DNA-binding transcriptional LysR family regulator